MAEASGSEYNFILNLIECVRQNKCLYDKKHPSYYNKLTKEKSWEDVAIKCNKTKAECRNKWKSIRERYAREIRKMEMPMDSGFAEQEQWRYFEDLTFLRASMMSRRPKSNEDNFAIPLGSDNAYTSTEDADFYDNFADNCSSSTPMSLKRERSSSDMQYTRSEEKISKIEQILVDPLEVSTTDELFAKTIVSLMKDLPLSAKDKFQADVYQHIFRLRAETRGD